MKNANKKMVFDLSKLPTLNFYKTEAENLKKYIDCLNKRKTLAKENFESKSEYEKNEVEILLLKTDWDLGKAYKSLNDRETKFVEISKLTNDYIKEINEKFDSLLARAKAYKLYPQVVAQIELEFDRVKDIDFDKDYDAKISFYNNIKTHIDSKPNKKK